MSEDEKIVSFPTETKKQTEDKLLWKCEACKHTIFESDEKKDTGNKVLPLNMGGIMIYCCPKCRTLQLPEEIFTEILRKATSKIIT